MQARGASHSSNRAVSLVEVSPSTVIWLNDACTARFTSGRHTSAATGASHVTTESIVAMFGWIIPEPLHMPPTRTGRPPTEASSAAAWAEGVLWAGGGFG